MRRIVYSTCAPILVAGLNTSLATKSASRGESCGPGFSFLAAFLHPFIFGGSAIDTTRFKLIINAFKTFLQYPHSIKDRAKIEGHSFPVITVCLNSMHSRKKLMNLHPELGIQPRGNEIKDNCSLWDFYGHNHDGLTHDLSLFDHINLESFYNETYSAFLMISCKYKKDDCTKWWKVTVS